MEQHLDVLGVELPWSGIGCYNLQAVKPEEFRK